VFKFIFLLIIVVITHSASAVKFDPTRPFGHKVASSVTSDEKKMVLESIIHGDGINTVVISGRLLKKFDYIGEYQLTAINQKSVILRSAVESIRLTIFKPNIVKVSGVK
jgi:hypothetical protein